MTESTNDILEKIKLSGNLPTPKGVALEVINLTRRENISNADVVKLIGADPVLSVRVLKAANMLLVNSTRQIVTVSDAILVLGFRPLRQLVMSISLISDYQSGPCKNFNYAHFWAHSLLTGIAVRHLTGQSRIAPPEEIFTIGLLGSIGQLVMASVYPAEFSAILAQAEKLTLDELYDLEREQFGFEEAELSAAVLADMNFPAMFQRLIHDYPQPERSAIASGTREWRLMNMLHLASLIADVIVVGQTGDFRVIRQLRLDAASLEIEEETVIGIAETCAREWPEWASILNVGARKIPSFSELFEQLDNLPADAGVTLH